MKLEVATKRPPRTLYKFRSFDSEGHSLRILSHNEIFFPQPARFNDPFEEGIVDRYDLLSRKEGLPMIEKAVARWFPRLTSAAAHRKAKEAWRDFKRPGFLEQHRKLVAETKAHMGIFCLCAGYKNLLLWAHYADRHTGFAIGFNRPILHDFCLYLGNEPTVKHSPLPPQPVTYCEEYPLIHPTRDTDQEQFDKQFLWKSKDWCYEEEYRMLLVYGADRVLPIPPEAITRVVLGCRINTTNKDAIIAILRSREMKPYLYQTHVSMDRFALQLERVRY